VRERIVLSTDGAGTLISTLKSMKMELFLRPGEN
jgi:hypothetical protein